MEVEEPDMKLKSVFFAILLCLSSSELLGQGQGSAGSEAPASADDIRKMFDVMHIRDQMKLIMQQVSQQMRSMEHDQIRKQQPHVSDEDIAKLDAMSDETLRQFSTEGLLDDMVPVYQKHLSKTDVDAMVGFYSTPTGQKILREMPAMTSEGIEAMQPRLTRMIDEANARIEKMMSEQMQEKKRPETARPNTIQN
jgi:uncharacterized protein